MVDRNRCLVLLLLLLLSLQVVACAQSAETTDKVEAAHVEPIEGTDLNHVTLTESAAERLDIQTEPIRQMQINEMDKKVIPYAAIIYDTNGNTWTYVSPEPYSFVREAIIVDYIEGDFAVLGEGPIVGTQVVTVGAAELYGIDTGVGK